MHPIIFRWGPLTLYSYGLMVALGFLAAMAVALRRARRTGLDPQVIQNTAFIALVAGILGARLAYVLLNWELFRADPMEILRLDHGGLVFYGGLAAGVAGGIVYLRARSLAILPTVDLLIPPLVLAHAIGRIGCFLNGCCYGRPTSLPWAVSFPLEGIPRHPTQLYESGFLLLLFLVLTRLWSIVCRPSSIDRRLTNDDRRTPGAVLLTYGLAYGTWRFFIEFLRADNPIFAWGLTVFQLSSLFLALSCGALLLARSKTVRVGKR